MVDEQTDSTFTWLDSHLWNRQQVKTLVRTVQIQKWYKYDPSVSIKTWVVKRNYLIFFTGTCTQEETNSETAWHVVDHTCFEKMQVDHGRERWWFQCRRWLRRWAWGRRPIGRRRVKWKRWWRLDGKWFPGGVIWYRPNHLESKDLADVLAEKDLLPKKAVTKKIQPRVAAPEKVLLEEGWEM
jgi:hypothetical protein